ncbi:hypothetical protein [Streptomyces sp. Root369]|uniref:hypothetical protein n=1 Tax=Streptomyces sp. Root369 TaxID=1736523 RepID=UPI000A836AF1|nr:hypothetical protein [Streptomyces sp. Root369]
MRWIGRLHLTQLPYSANYFDPYAQRRRVPWDQLDDPAMHFRGPWPLLDEVNRLHPGNREGHHRMREYFLYRGGGAAAAMQFSAWLVSGRLSNPELLMLPVYSLLDLYRERHGDGRGRALQFWQTAQVRHYACRAYDEWFAPLPATEYPWLSISDLSHLAPPGGLRRGRPGRVGVQGDGPLRHAAALERRERQPRPLPGLDGRIPAHPRVRPAIAARWRTAGHRHVVNAPLTHPSSFFHLKVDLWCLTEALP